MTERDVLQIVFEEETLRTVFGDLDSPTDFNSPRWEEVDSIVLQSCFDKGFLTWNQNKLVVTDLGRRTFGGYNE